MWQSIVFLAAFFIGSATLRASEQRPDRGPLKYTQEIFKPTEQWAVDAIYDTLEMIDELCRLHNIPYALTGGTLLGSHWYDGLIKWDDDGDLVMLEEDVERLLALRDELERRGYAISTSEWGYYIFPLNGLPSKKGKNYPAIDLFPLKMRNGKYRCAIEKAYRKWPKEYISVDEWSRITDVPFGHLTLRGHTGPDAERMLNSSYGTDWKRVACSWWDHKNERRRKMIYVRLEEHTPALRSPK